MPQRANTHAKVAIKNFSFHNKNAHLGIFCSLPWGVLLIPRPGRGGATRRGRGVLQNTFAFRFFYDKIQLCESREERIYRDDGFRSDTQIFLFGSSHHPDSFKSVKNQYLDSN